MDIASWLKNLCPGKSAPIVLELDLSRGVVISAASNPLEALKTINSPSLRAIREGLRKARSDDRVKGMIVHVGAAPIPPAVADELTHLVRDFGRYKPTIAYSETFGEVDSAVFAFQLAASASSVWLQPSGRVCIGGLRLGISLLKGTLAKLGIEPQFGQRHEYKTAADQFVADEVSQANREMTTRIGQSMMDSAVASIAHDRSLRVETVWDAVNHFSYTPQQARDSGLIDHIGYRDQVYAYAHEQWGTQPSQQIFVHRYADSTKLSDLGFKPSRPTVAIVDIRGGIVFGRSQPGVFGRVSGSDDVCDQIRAAARDEKVKALVLNVDSPGGSYIGSDTIRRAVIQFRETGRPVIAAMENVAASGGYFVSMAANEILAQATTLTGSIGVLSGKMVLRGLYEKIGLTRESIGIGARANAFDPGQPFTEEDWNLLNAELDRIYADFTQKAAADRGMPLDVLEPLARGRVWTGADAAENGLINGLGGMETALDKACDLARLDREAVSIRVVGALGILERLRPARSSESLAGGGLGLPSSSDDLMSVAARALGIHLPGVLSLPLVPTVGG